MDNSFCVVAPGQGSGCTGCLASSVSLVLGKGVRCVPEETSSFPDFSFSRITARWGWEDCGGSCEVHLSNPKEKRKLLWRTGPRQLSSGLGNSCVSYRNSLGSAVNPLPHFLFSKSKAAGNHLLYTCKRWSHDSSVPSPNWAVLAPSYHTPAPSLWLSVDLSEIQANGGKREITQDAHVLVLDAPWMTSSSLLLLKWMTEMNALWLYLILTLHADWNMRLKNYKPWDKGKPWGFKISTQSKRMQNSLINETAVLKISQYAFYFKLVYFYQYVKYLKKANSTARCNRKNSSFFSPSLIVSS